MHSPPLGRRRQWATNTNTSGSAFLYSQFTQTAAVCHWQHQNFKDLTVTTKVCPYPNAHRRRDMDKQLHLFRQDNCSTVWQMLPEPIRQRIESIFSELIIQHLSSLSREIEKYEK